MRKILFILMLFGTFAASCNRSAKVQQSDNASDTNHATSLSVKGRLIVGHEVSSFISTGDTLDYWVVDKTDRLDSLYKRAVGENSAPYTPVYVELKVNDMGKSTEGFAADYDGVYEVVEIVEMKNDSDIAHSQKGTASTAP